MKSFQNKFNAKLRYSSIAFFVFAFWCDSFAQIDIGLSDLNIMVSPPIWEGTFSLAYLNVSVPSTGVGIGTSMFYFMQSIKGFPINDKNKHMIFQFYDKDGTYFGKEGWVDVPYFPILKCWFPLQLSFTPLSTYTFGHLINSFNVSTLYCPWASLSGSGSGDFPKHKGRSIFDDNSIFDVSFNYDFSQYLALNVRYSSMTINSKEYKSASPTYFSDQYDSIRILPYRTNRLYMGISLRLRYHSVSGLIPLNQSYKSSPFLHPTIHGGYTRMVREIERLYIRKDIANLLKTLSSDQASEATLKKSMVALLSLDSLSAIQPLHDNFFKNHYYPDCRRKIINDFIDSYNKPSTIATNIKVMLSDEKEISNIVNASYYNSKAVLSFLSHNSRELRKKALTAIYLSAGEYDSLMKAQITEAIVKLFLIEQDSTSILVAAKLFSMFADSTQFLSLWKDTNNNGIFSVLRQVQSGTTFPIRSDSFIKSLDTIINIDPNRIIALAHCDYCINNKHIIFHLIRLLPSIQNKEWRISIFFAIRNYMYSDMFTELRDDYEKSIRYDEMLRWPFLLRLSQIIGANDLEWLLDWIAKIDNRSVATQMRKNVSSKITAKNEPVLRALLKKTSDPLQFISLLNGIKSYSDYAYIISLSLTCDSETRTECDTFLNNMCKNSNAMQTILDYYNNEPSARKILFHVITNNITKIDLTRLEDDKLINLIHSLLLVARDTTLVDCNTFSIVFKNYYKYLKPINPIRKEIESYVFDCRKMAISFSQRSKDNNNMSSKKKNLINYEFIDIPGNIDINPFKLGKYEVTVGQFRQFVAATNYKTIAEKQGWSEGYDHRDWVKIPNLNWRYGIGIYDIALDSQPVAHVTTEDALRFSEWIGGRLPTNLEWTHAARGGLIGEPFVWGFQSSPPQNSGNFPDKSGRQKYPDWNYIRDYNDGYADAAPVGKFSPNGYGLYDMAGNVWERVSEEDEIRGGSFFGYLFTLVDETGSVTFKIPYSGSSPYIGFRVAKDD